MIRLTRFLGYKGSQATVLIAAVVIIVLAAGLVVVANASKVSATGMDVLVTFSDGSTQQVTGKSGSLSLLSPKQLTAIDLSTGRKIDKIDFKPWVEIDYTGVISSWKMDVSMDYTSQPATATTSEPPVTLSGTASNAPKVKERRYLGTYPMPASIIEKLISVNGDYIFVATSTVKVSLTDSAGKTVTGQGASSGKVAIRINHSTENLPLSIVAVNMGTETFAWYLAS